MENMSIISQPNVHIVNVSAAIYTSELNTLYKKSHCVPDWRVSCVARGENESRVTDHCYARPGAGLQRDGFIPQLDKTWSREPSGPSFQR